MRNSIAQLVGSIAKHDLQENQWPELLQFLQQYTKSEQSEHREVRNHVRSIVSNSVCLFLDSNMIIERNLACSNQCMNVKKIHGIDLDSQIFILYRD